MKCSIIIRSYNEEKYIRRLMIGLGQQNLNPCQVILVDSGSTDQTIEIAANYGAQVIQIDKREFSFGRALNVGCSHAQGDILVFASAHTYPSYNNWLETLVAPFVDNRVVLSYGRQRGNHLTRFSEKQLFAKWFPTRSECPQSETYFCNNANSAIRRSIWLNQPYDEKLTGLEDLAWAKLAQAKGGWIAYQAQAEIIHVHEETWLKIRNRYRREAMAMKSIEEHAHFSLLDFIRLLAQNIQSDCYEALRKRVLLHEAISICLFRFNQFFGTYLGYNAPLEAASDIRNRFYFPINYDDSPDTFPELEQYRIDYDALEHSQVKVILNKS